jgi:hypothetical protein
VIPRMPIMAVSGICFLRVSTMEEKVHVHSCSRRGKKAGQGFWEYDTQTIGHPLNLAPL